MVSPQSAVFPQMSVSVLIAHIPLLLRWGSGQSKWWTFGCGARPMTASPRAAMPPTPLALLRYIADRSMNLHPRSTGAHDAGYPLQFVILLGRRRLRSAAVDCSRPAVAERVGRSHAVHYCTHGASPICTGAQQSRCSLAGRLFAQGLRSPVQRIAG